VRLQTITAFSHAACRVISAGSAFLLPATQKGSKKMNVPTIDIQQTGANIKALRKAAGIKVKDVADTLGVSTQAVAKWQAGTALPTIDNLVILAAMLDTKIDDILVIA
jgi:DNA-binding transcriptional regulator YiaG